MSEYYQPRRLPYSSDVPETHLTHISHRDNDIGASHSILVFPNPPSDHETSRSESRFGFYESSSLPTDMSFGDDSPSRSRSRDNLNGTERSWDDSSKASSRKEIRHLGAEGHELELCHDNRWDRIRYGGCSESSMGVHSHTTCPSVSSLSNLTQYLTPQPPFHLPFLSILRTIFDLDESTLHLLSRSPNFHPSVLFPCQPASSSVPNGHTEEEPVHGFHKLLLDNPDKPKSGALFKAVLDSSEFPWDKTPLLAAPARIPAWQMLESMFEGGLRAWGEVRAWHSNGEPRLIGV